MKDSRQANLLERAGRDGRAFTLLELLVVAGLIAGMSFLLFGALGGSGRSSALQAGQTTLSNLVAAARNRAVASGHATRLLVHHDVRSPLAAERYLRLVALEELDGAQWRTLQALSLPRGIQVLPHGNHTPPGLLADATAWRRIDGTRLQSSALFRALVPRQVDAPVVELWAEVAFSAHGTTATPGQLVVTAGRTNLEPARGEPSVVFDQPGMVRGLQLSVYGRAVTIDGREGF